MFIDIHRLYKLFLRQIGYEELVNCVFRLSKMSYEVCCPGIKPQSIEKNCVKDWKSFFVLPETAVPHKVTWCCKFAMH